MNRIFAPCQDALLTATALPAAAQHFPDRPVKLILPWAAGGDTDGIFRPFAAMMQKHIGQPVVVGKRRRRLGPGQISVGGTLVRPATSSRR